MQNRRETLKHSLAVAGLLGATGLFPQYAFAFTKAAFMVCIGLLLSFEAQTNAGAECRLDRRQTAR